MRFRLPRPAATLAAGLALVLLLAGCVPPDPIITPEPGPGATPVFASDEEALAAATDAYAKYLKVSDEITNDGGMGAERISSLVTPEQFLRELDGFKKLQVEGLRTQGSSTSAVKGLQRYVDSSSGTAEVVIYVCVDVSAVRILNGSGQDVTRAGRPDTIPLEVEFEVTQKIPTEMTISRSEPWSGNDFCQR